VLGAAGTGNMGQSIARRFAAEGAGVTVAGRQMPSLEALAEEIGGYATYCDITQVDGPTQLATSARERLGHVDIAVNATGWSLLKPFLDTTEDELQGMTELQFNGPFRFFQAVIRAMDRGGSLIQISSATATIMFEHHAAYMGTKAGIDHVMRAIANEFGSRNIRANSISPGLTDTPMVAELKATPGAFDAFLPGYPLGRIGTQDDIAAACVWLASDECFITGENLQVNGGLTLRRNPTLAEIERASASA
jgi:NAD(P)-dependent dehydrogenase (short-subunit alcohol dehydrogenase family)